MCEVTIEYEPGWLESCLGGTDWKGQNVRRAKDQKRTEIRRPD